MKHLILRELWFLIQIILYLHDLLNHLKYKELSNLKRREG